MEVVIMDVHPIDVGVMRDNGTVAHPRLIAFQDEATGRVWCELIQFENGGDVRNSDIIRAFARMVEHPEFGMPGTLYADNGSEYNFADFFEDALRSNNRFNKQLLVKEKEKRVTRAIAYNASAKPIEGFFGRFEARYLSTLKVLCGCTYRPIS